MSGGSDKNKQYKLSPMMERYLNLKQHYLDCLVFYRLGDFYEMFFDDAKIASQELQLQLTGRDCGLKERAPMCGVPHHSVNVYINRLLEKNYKVAICEQLTDVQAAKASKTLVERGIVRVVTPGTIIEDDMLDGKQNNFLASVSVEKNNCGIAWADVSTGEFYFTEFALSRETELLTDKLFEIRPNEIIADSEACARAEEIPEYIKKQFRPFSGADAKFSKENIKLLCERFPEAAETDKQKQCALRAAAALWAYLCDTQKNELVHMTALKYIGQEEHLILDPAAVKNLELFRSLGDHGTRGTLLWLLDKTNTPMGGRKMRSWMERPMRSKADIVRRLDAVEEIKNDYGMREDLKEALANVLDVERICTRISYGTVAPKELAHMRQSLLNIPRVKELLSNAKSETLVSCFNGIDTLEDISGLLVRAIAEAPSESINDGDVINKGYSEELDKLRDAVKHGQEWINQLEIKEREQTGIKNLKIKFNKVFGYTIEVSNSNTGQVPERFIRRQTLTGGERYVTEELKELESLVLGSEEKALRLENKIFSEVRQTLFEALARLKSTAEAIAETDALCALALVADEYSYVRPKINTEGKIEITDGRHPVIEAMQKDRSFVPNDTFLDTNDNRFAVITGPNMAGKSTYMRQVALITLMAHMGSFVPARSADISVCDRIFTRVGASDDLSAGQSTFMLEMNEVAGIIRNATSESLIILDEIGRGTSTFDGLAIAWAVTEYIADKKNIGAKTLFATHYHELSELEGNLDGVKNYCITAKEFGDGVIFLRKIMRGSADKSFGIAVAHLAGIPKPVLKRAGEILSDIEKADITRTDLQPAATQTAMFASDNVLNIVEELKNVDINTLTPIQAMNLLCELREKAKREL